MTRRWIPEWWYSLVGEWHTRDLDRLYAAVQRADVSINDKINVTRIWREMLQAREKPEDKLQW